MSLLKLTSRLLLITVGLFLFALGCETVVQQEGTYSLPSEKKEQFSILDSRLKSLRSQAKQYPKKHSLHYQIAGIHFQKEAYQECVSALARAIDLSPNQSRYHYHMGRAYEKMGELGQAELSFEKAVQHVPPGRYTGPHAAYGYILARNGKLERAKTQFKLCTRIEPDDPSFYYWLGSLSDMTGDVEGTIHNYREYLRRGGWEYRKKALFVLSKLGIDMEVTEPATVHRELSPENLPDDFAAPEE